MALAAVIEDELGELFHRAGCQSWLYVAEVDGEGAVAVGADEPVVAASVIKVPVALEVYRQVAGGRLDPRERIRMLPSRRTPGPTGISVFADEAELSVSDLATLMLTISDNAATDALIERVGLDSIHATLASFGLRRTVIPSPLRDQLDTIGHAAGYAGYGALARASSSFSAEERDRVDQRILGAAALDPLRGLRTTAREMGALLRLIWRDEAGPAAACAAVRLTMSRQVTRQRLATGFPRRGHELAAKSGSLAGLIRNEVGVVTLPDGGRYAAAVFTRAHRPGENEHEIDASIGAAAARAIAHLRGG